MLNTGGSAPLTSRNCRDASFSYRWSPNIPLNKREADLTASIPQGRHLKAIVSFLSVNDFILLNYSEKESTAPCGRWALPKTSLTYNVNKWMQTLLVFRRLCKSGEQGYRHFYPKVRKKPHQENGETTKKCI